MERLPDELEQVARIRHRVNGANETKPRRRINWPSTVTATDDPTNEEVDIAISGVTPGGSAGGVLDGTYPNPGLAASVAGDGLTETSNVLSVNAGTGLEISSDTVRIAAAAAGDGLTGGAGSALAVAPGTGLEISSDTVRIAAAAAGNGLTGGGASALAVNPDGTSIDISGDAVRRMAISGDVTIAAGSGTAAITSGVIVAADFSAEAAIGWTPTVGGAGWAIGNGTVSGFFMKHGNLIVAIGYVVFGSTSTFGGGQLQIGGLADSAAARMSCVANYGDVSLLAGYNGLGHQFSGFGGALNMYADVGLGGPPSVIAEAAVINTYPFTWANGDSVLICAAFPEG